jgi:hypothetical protein
MSRVWQAPFGVVVDSQEGREFAAGPAYIGGEPSPAQLATGFQTGAFGTPTTVWDQIETASGFQTGVAFGSPAAAWDRFETATGFQTGAFGTPDAFLHKAQGFTSTAFGSASVLIALDATGFQTGAFGIPTEIALAVAEGFQTGVAFGLPSASFVAKASTWTLSRTARFGRPVKIPEDRDFFALGGRSTRFGTPAKSPADNNVVAWPWPAGPRFGDAIGTHDVTVVASGFLSGRPSPVHVGSFTAPDRLVRIASGWMATQFGTVTLAVSVSGAASSLAPGATIPGASARFVLGASGLYNAVNVGQPDSVGEYLASDFKNTYHFGSVASRFICHGQGRQPRTRFGSRAQAA